MLLLSIILSKKPTGGLLHTNPIHAHMTGPFVSCPPAWLQQLRVGGCRSEGRQGARGQAQAAQPLCAAAISLPAFTGALGSSRYSPALVPCWHATCEAWGGCAPTCPVAALSLQCACSAPCWKKATAFSCEGNWRWRWALPVASWHTCCLSVFSSASWWLESMGHWAQPSVPQVWECLVPLTLMPLCASSSHADFVGWVRLKSLLFLQKTAGMLLLKSVFEDNKIPEKFLRTCIHLQNPDCWHFRWQRLGWSLGGGRHSSCPTAFAARQI